MHNEFTVEASLDNLDLVLGNLEEMLEAHDCSMKLIMKINVCVEELFVNVANYAYDEDADNKYCEFRIDITDLDDQELSKRAEITLIDSGKEFNPLLRENPDITLSADERPIGGLGIFMVKNMMDDVIYKYNDNKNEITLVKAW